MSFIYMKYQQGVRTFLYKIFRFIFYHEALISALDKKCMIEFCRYTKKYYINVFNFRSDFLQDMASVFCLYSTVTEVLNK